MGLQKLGVGRYRVFIDLGRDAQGKRRRVTEVVQGTKKEAEARERALLRERDSGTYVEPNRLTVAEFMHRWIASVEGGVSPNTYRGYEQRTRTHIVPDLGGVRLMELSPLHIEAAERMWLASGNRRTGGALDPQTVLHIHRCLHRAMDRAVKWHLIPLNPVDGVDAPHVAEKEQEFLTPAEAERVTAVLEGNPYELPILVGLYGGLRPAEYLGLRWRDVDLDTSDVRVLQNVHRIRQDLVTIHMGVEVWGAGENAPIEAAGLDAGRPDGPAAQLEERAGGRALKAPVWADLDL